MRDSHSKSLGKENLVLGDGFTRILVIDDTDEIRYMVSKMLSLMRYEVLSANSGEKGLNLLMKNRFDLVITDLDMPGMDGYSLASHIKENFPNTSVILMTGNENNEPIDKFNLSPVNQVLLKPFGYREFEEAIKKMMGP
ncbi:MAG: response regulator [Desulfobacterales bacterium]